jgi:hypothetical protein
MKDKITTPKTFQKSFNNVENFKFWGRTLTNINCTRNGTKNLYYSGKAYYHSFQNLFAVLDINIRRTKYKTTVLPVLLSGSET